MRSFIIPFLLFPLTLLAVYAFPKPELSDNSAHTIAMLFSLRTAATWLLFFGAIYWLTGEIDRRKHFYQFVTAMNWLTIPATVIFLPIAWYLYTGAYSWDELNAIMMSLMFYTYMFTAFMAAKILRIPWELGGFICMISILIDDSTNNLLYWVGSII
jgi:hypothetical protein